MLSEQLLQAQTLQLPDQGPTNGAPATITTSICDSPGKLSSDSGVGDVASVTPVNAVASSGDQPRRKRRQDWCRWMVCQPYYATGHCENYDETTANFVTPICQLAHIYPPASTVPVTPDGFVRVCFDSMGLVQPNCQRAGCSFYHPPKYIRDQIVAKRHEQYLREKVARTSLRGVTGEQGAMKMERLHAAQTQPTGNGQRRNSFKPYTNSNRTLFPQASPLNVPLLGQNVMPLMPNPLLDPGLLNLLLMSSSLTTAPQGPPQNSPLPTQPPLLLNTTNHQQVHQQPQNSLYYSLTQMLPTMMYNGELPKTPLPNHPIADLARLKDFGLLNSGSENLLPTAPYNPTAPPMYFQMPPYGDTTTLTTDSLSQLRQ